MTSSDQRFFTVDEQGTWWRVNENARWRGPCANTAEADDSRDCFLINQADRAADFAADNHAFAGG